MKSVNLLMIVLSVCEACRSSVPVKLEDTKQEVSTQETIKKVGSNLSLPAPYPKNITIKEGGRVIVAWDPVEVTPDNPILGLKIKLWDEEKQQTYKYVEVNGTLVLTDEWTSIKKEIRDLPHHKPAFEAVLPPDAVQTSFVVKLGEKYEIRGQSYNAEGDGPLSSATDFKIDNE